MGIRYMKNPKILLIIPAYNEEANILRVYNNIVSYNKKANNKLDVVFINDGSKDNTENIGESKKSRLIFALFFYAEQKIAKFVYEIIHIKIED